MRKVSCPNGLIKTHLVSFPRSGHHLMVRGLQWVLQGRLVYSNFYASKHNFENCSFVNLQKNHDLKLDMEIQPDYNYIILTRAFEQAVESWWEGAGKPGTFKAFRQKYNEYYGQFNEKWVLQPKENMLVIPYHDFIARKSKYLQQVYDRMSPEPMNQENQEWMAKWEVAELNKKPKTIKNGHK